MRNLSIRWKILGGVLLVNLLGAAAIMIYLHQAYSSSLDTSVQATAMQGVASWEELQDEGAKLDPVASVDEVNDLLTSMKKITNADYGFLLDKEATTQEAYAKMREDLGLADNWDEGDVYVTLAATDEDVAQTMQFAVTPESVPEAGKIVGVENGACSQACHDNVTGEGDYWAVRWSTDRSTRGHSVFPVAGADGEPIGVIYTVGDISDQADAARASMMQTLWVVLITLIVAGLIVVGMVNSMVLKRIDNVTRSIEDLSLRIAGGDFDAHYEPSGAQDEIGRFEEFFAKLIDVISSTLKSLSGGKGGGS